MITIKDIEIENGDLMPVHVSQGDGDLVVRISQPGGCMSSVGIHVDAVSELVKVLREHLGFEFCRCDEK